jgi:hypothetical protein
MRRRSLCLAAGLLTLATACGNGADEATSTPRERAAELCAPGDVELRLSWETAATGLEGTLVATNRRDEPCDLTLVPKVQPLAADGSPLPVPFGTSRIGLHGPITVRANESATAQVGWGSPWCGNGASGTVSVTLGDAPPVEVAAQGPRQPACEPKDGGNTWASQFEVDAG